MIHLFRNRITLVWFILVTATAASWEFGHGFGNLSHAGFTIIVIAFIKVRYVILDFMEIRHAPIPMRMAGEIWTVVVCIALVVLYLRSTVPVFTS
jgi:hypothetical protein